jgi:iron(III) transport system ATP-binding protein
MIRLENIEVTFGDFTAIPRLNLEVKQGEFFTLLGPSGCGKTTALRTLAGFISPSAGEVYVDGKAVTRLPSDKRHVGMVFQNYALFPTMSVWDNIAFGLRVRKEKPAESDRLVHQIAKRVDLSDAQLRKNVAELSGGQQQRVAVARALVLQPKILLLDEPLSNLDAKLRHQLRQQLKDLQSEFGITTVYVTHDQDEALAMSDRVAVFNKGVVEQVGTPQTVYDQSATEFVCNFIGDSSAITSEFVRELNRQSRIPLDPGARSYLRVEKATLAPEGGYGPGFPDGSATLDGVVKSRSYHGLHSRYIVHCHGSDLSIIVREDGSPHPETGSKARVQVRPQDVLQYDSQTRSRLENPALEVSRP